MEHEFVKIECGSDSRM